MPLTEHQKNQTAALRNAVAAGERSGESNLSLHEIAAQVKKETRLTALDASIARGFANVEAGRTMPAGGVFKRLEYKYRAMADKSTDHPPHFETESDLEQIGESREDGIKPKLPKQG